MAHQSKAYCKDCGKPVRWCATDGGRRMPLDADHEDRYVLDPATDPMIGRRRKTYTCHFDTCPKGAAAQIVEEKPLF